MSTCNTILCGLVWFSACFSYKLSIFLILKKKFITKIG